MLDNVLEFCDVSGDIRARLEDIIFNAKSSRTRDDVRDYGRQAFELLAPKASADVLLSSTKDFTRLNCDEHTCRAGIHVIRSYFAHLIRNMHRAETKYRTEYSKEYDEHGIVVVHDFLEDTLRNRVTAEIQKMPEAMMKISSNIISFNTESIALNIMLNKSYMKPILFDCLAYTRPEVYDLYAKNTFVQRLRNVPKDGDVQKILHSDTFFPCIKWWYFPDEVKMENGPFVYVPGSHIFTRGRAKFLYEQSIAVATYKLEAARTYGHAEGSLRVFENELSEMGLTEKPYIVPANSLIVANVYGLHRRSEVVTVGHRDSVHGSIRVNTPFV